MNVECFRSLELTKVFPHPPVEAPSLSAFDEEYMCGLYCADDSVAGCEFGYGSQTKAQLVFIRMHVIDNDPIQIHNGNRILRALNLPELLGENGEPDMTWLGVSPLQKQMRHSSIVMWKGFLNGLHFLISRYANEPISLVEINDIELVKANVMEMDRANVDVEELLQA